jgi:prepilin-type N-terminal cleavage/methylation domain-containing protein
VPGLTRHHSARCQRGFTLIESLMASGVLLITVLAVSAALTAGQQHAYEAHQRIAGALAAEEMMGRVSSYGFDELRPLHRVEAVGELVDAARQPFPESFAGVGREIWILETMEKIEGLNVQIRGYRVRVRTFDANNITLADIGRFVPEPASATYLDDDSTTADSSSGSSGGLLGNLLGIF